MASSWSCESGVVVCGHLFSEIGHCMLAHCNAILFVPLSSFHLLLAISTPFFSAFLWAGIQLIVRFCVNIDALVALVLYLIRIFVFSVFSQFFTAVNESCSSDMRMVIISASRTNAESLSLMMIYSSLSTTAAASRILSLLLRVCDIPAS